MKKYLNFLVVIFTLNYMNSIDLQAQSRITAQVTDVSGSQIVIDQGSTSGLREDAEGVVYYMQRVGSRNVTIAVALVRVISVTSDTAQLEIVDSTAELQKGYLVELSIPKKKSKWWIWLIVAAAGGGVAAAVGGGGGGGGGGTATPTTGTISIDLPAN